VQARELLLIITAAVCHSESSKPLTGARLVSGQGRNWG